MLTLDVQRETIRLGSEYGGWEVVPDRLGAQSVVYAFGVGEDASFDTALIEMFGASVHAFDPTRKSIRWVRSQKWPDAFNFHSVGVADFDGQARFNPPTNPDHVSATLLDRPDTASSSYEAEVRRVQTLMRELGHDRLDLLKLDVEGAEYAVIEDLRASGVRPGQLLVEFHHRFGNVSVEQTRQAVRTIRSMGYALYWISPSNQECGFVRKDA